MSIVEVQSSWMFVIVNRDGLVWGRLSKWTDEAERFICYEKRREAVRAAKELSWAEPCRVERHFMMLVEVTPCRPQPEYHGKTPN